MKSILSIALAAVMAGAACSRRAAPVQTAEAASVASGAVRLPPESPMLRQIARAPVRFADLPTDELTVPGKIEANPTQVAKVTLPVTGRITAVLVKPGDAVKRDQPLLTIQSPDADAAMSAYLSAQAGVAQAEAAQGKAQSDFDRAS